MRQDLTTAVRSLRSTPTLTLAALVILTLGIGAATTIFSVVDAVVLRGLPFEQADRLVAVMEHIPGRATTFAGGRTTPQTYLDWRARQQAFAGMAAVAGTRFDLRNAAGEPVLAQGHRVTREFFPVLRVRPLLGRTFTEEDEVHGRHRVAILSHGFWQRRFGGDPEVLGQQIEEVNGESWEIVGVMPREFSYPVASDRPSEVFVPLAFAAEDTVRGGSRNFNYVVIARLGDGTSVAQADEQMDAIAAALDQEHPKWAPGRRVRVVPLHEALVGTVRGWMLMLLGAVAFVLLVAWANVANLLLVRAAGRAREMGVRAALGASRWRLVRGLLVESLLLALAGSVCGLFVAYGGVQVLRAWLPADLPRVATIAVDVRVLAAAVGVAFATGITFGLVPALQASRSDVTGVLRDGGRAATAGAAGRRLHSGLAVAEIALAVVLLVGAGLFTSSFLELMRIDTGFDYRNVLALEVSAYEPGRPFRELIARGGPYAEQVIEAVRAVPGVETAAAVANGLPLSGAYSQTTVRRSDGREWSDGDRIDQRFVTPGYLPLMRIPLRKGRHLEPQDRRGTTPVVVINESAARMYFPGEEALGQQLTFVSEKEARTIVGIVGDIRHHGPETPARQEAYIPMAQAGVITSTIVLRTSVDPLTVLPAAKKAIWSVNPNQSIDERVVTLEGYMDGLISERRFTMALLGIFGIMGLTIAAAGIFSMMAHVVAQRTGEIGVRMALGSTPARVVRLVLKRAVAVTFAGLATGAVGAWYLSATVQSYLFQLEATDGRVFAAALVLLGCVSLLASLIPARRAAMVDPAIAIRQG